MTDEHNLAPAQVAELFGEPVKPTPVDEDEMQVALVLRQIRSLLAEAADSEKVGVTELASRLNVSPSVVSRMLRSEGDMRVSTAVMWAQALGRVWDINLCKARTEAFGVNHPMATTINNAISVSGTAAPEVRSVDIGDVRRPWESPRVNAYATA